MYLDDPDSIFDEHKRDHYMTLRKFLRNGSMESGITRVGTLKFWAISVSLTVKSRKVDDIIGSIPFFTDIIFEKELMNLKNTFQGVLNSFRNFKILMLVKLLKSSWPISGSI